MTALTPSNPDRHRDDGVNTGDANTVRGRELRVNFVLDYRR